MTLISQRVDNFLGGVSQQDERLRDATQASEQVNCLTDPAHGLMKRPGSAHELVLSSTPGDFDGNDVFVHEITRDGDEKFFLVVRNGGLKVIKASDGSEMTLYTPEGVSYLSGSNFRAQTFGNTTIVVNQDTEVDTLADEASQRTPEALVFVRQADYSTIYVLQIGSYRAVHTTPAANNAEARQALDTSEIARELHNELLAQTGFTSDFSTERMGSTIYITRSNGEDFYLDARDGLADKGLLAVKESVQRFEDLPIRAKDGFVCQVLGDPGTEFDDHWVVYDESTHPEEFGVWRETVQPGTRTKLDPDTMPHELVLKGAFTDQGVSRGAPPEPIIRSVKYDSETFGWDSVVSGGSGSGITDEAPVITDQDDEVSVDISDVPDEPVEIDIRINADTTFVDPHTTVRLIVEHDDGGGYAGIADREVLSGENLQGIKIPLAFTPTASSTLRTRLEYSTGATPTTTRLARVTFPPDISEITTPTDDIVEPRRPITRRRKLAKSVAFGPDRIYPADFQLTLTCDASPFNYTPNSNETGEQVAQAFQSLIDADGGFSAAEVNAGEIQIVAGDGSSVVTVSYSTAFDPSQHVWFEELDLTGLTLDGATVRNITDGSTGTITSHTDAAITASGGLAGGTDDTFEKGDSIEIIQSGTYWVFRPSKWRSREVGSMTTNPFPEFVDEKITDVSFYQGRLVFVFKDSVHTSAAGDVTNLFRDTAISLKANDPVAATAATPKETIFHAALPWAGYFWLISENGPVLLSGDPVLTPETVRMDFVASLESTKNVRPVVLGGSLFLTQETPNGQVRVHEARIARINSQGVPVLDLRDTTRHVPTFIQGTPWEMYGNHSLGLLVLITRTTLATPYNTRIWVYRFLDEGDRRLISSWSEWTLSDPLVASTMLGDEIGFIRYGNGEVTWETINVNDPPLSAQEGKARQLDRYVRSDEESLSPSFAAGDTTFTLPYNIAVDGSEGDLAVVRLDDGTVYSGGSITRPQTDQVVVTGVDLTSVDVAVGVLYDQDFTPTPIYFRDELGVPDTRGSLRLTYVDLHYHETTDLTVTVTITGRSDNVYTLDVASPQDGTLKVPIYSAEASIRITNPTPGACNLSSLDWEGVRVVRSRRN